MPLGAALAFKGIKKSILMLHGSQGCSTYMRRYISTHYDEPMDIASSSLTEKGTVYGGEENLTQGLKNVIKLYDPEVIGVATTCLAGTIGEDINRLVKEYIAKEDIEDISIIPVETPGYESSQFDGYYVTVKKIIDQFAAAEEKTEKINIIAGNLTPADIRRIKSLMELFGLEYNLILKNCRLEVVN
jgi:nitrogenase molybdenum-iron protein NifN